MSHMALRVTSSVPGKGQSFTHGPKVCVQELTWLWVPTHTQLCPAALGLCFAALSLPGMETLLLMLLLGSKWGCRWPQAGLRGVAWHVQGVTLERQEWANALVSENNIRHFSFSFQGKVGTLEDCIF